MPSSHPPLPGVGLGDIRKVGVAAHSVLIPQKHGIDCHAKLDRIVLVDAAGSHPEVFKSIGCGLIRTEPYLPLPCLAHSFGHVRADLDILKDDLLSPGMREYCVGRDIATCSLAKDDLAVEFALQEAYKRHG